jgi:aldehyde dehydrogenase
MQFGSQRIDEALVADVVKEVLQRLGCPPSGAGAAAPARRVADAAGPPAARRSTARTHGVFNNVDEAVAAATRAQRELLHASLEARAKAVECIRRVMRRDQDELSRIEFAETKIGRLVHKFEKLEIAAAVPGLEMLRTEATSGDHGLTVTEYAPYGVIGVVTPVTHSIPTLGCNAIMMISAGNALVCNPHPSGAQCAVEATRRWNREICNAVDIDNLICIIATPTIESAGVIFKHPGVRMICVTGGQAVAQAALASGKRAVAAGPGNPPVVVDETADLAKAGKGIVAGAGYDNNLLCIGEKEVFVVQSVAEALLEGLARGGGHRVNKAQLDRIAERVLVKDAHSGHWVPRREFVGQDPQVFADLIGVRIAPETKVLFGPADESNPLFPCEQMIPVLPVLACRDVHEAIAKAVQYEHGFKHTAIMWSRNVENLTTMGRAVDTTLYIKNGPCVAGLGSGGEGYSSFSIATTGEGVTSPLTFTRYRRCTMVDSLRIF